MFTTKLTRAKGGTALLGANLIPLLLLLGIAVAPTTTQAQIAPPFWGTIFIDPDIITPTDPTTFQQVAYTGQETRTMYDRRVPGWISITPFLFNATFDDGLSIEIQVNPEFGSSDDALVQAERFAPIIGRLPTALRADVQTAWIHEGVEPFGGGNNNLLIHTGQADVYEADGILEETFVHEAAHTSLDSYHATAPSWLAAQNADPTFISSYARDFPVREDVAESFVTYLAIRYKSDRIRPSLADSITATIPNRIAYFDALGLDMYPMFRNTVANETDGTVPNTFALAGNYPNPFNPSTQIRYTLSERASVTLAVYDAIGRLVGELVNEDQNAGWHTVRFDAANLPAGLYFYRLETGSFSAVKKMVLIR